MTRPRRSKGGRPRGTGRTRACVSVSRETFRLMQAASIARGVSMQGLVEEACAVLSMREGETTVESHREDCPDCVAEKAGV